MEYCRYKQKVKKNKHGEDLKKIRSYLLNTGGLDCYGPGTYTGMV